ncbi:unnamed protein product, partial [Allacma fusca]
MVELSKTFFQRGYHFDPQNQRIRCLAHIVNLSCQDALSVLKCVRTKDIDSPAILENNDSDEMSSEEADSDDSIDSERGISTNVLERSNNQSLYMRMRLAICKIRRSKHLRDTFKEFCLMKKMKPKMLILDNNTRWNSTFNMMLRFFEMRQAFEALVRSEKQLESITFQEEEWTLLEDMLEFLKPFKQMTLDLSKAHQPNMALSAAVYIELYKHVEKYSTETGSRSEIVEAAVAACEKLNKYYATSDGLVYVMGLLLNPRCKLEWYSSVGIETRIINANKRAAIQHWNAQYSTPAPACTDVDEQCGDILALQMKRAKPS